MLEVSGLGQRLLLNFLFEKSWYPGQKSEAVFPTDHCRVTPSGSRFIPTFYMTYASNPYRTHPAKM